jgi:DnaJ like chaperone protein
MQYRNYNNGSNFFWLGILIFFLFGGFKTLLLLGSVIFILIPALIFIVVFFKILGAVVKNQSIHNSLKNHSDSRLRYVELIIHILVGAMKIDGKIDGREIQAILSFFQRKLGFTGNQIQWVQDLIRYAVFKNYRLEEVVANLNAQFGSDEKMLCSEVLFEVVAADSKITAEERAYVDKVLELLGIDEEYVKQLKQKYYSASATMTDYEILGVPNGTSFDEVKRAYRNLSKQYHPDKVLHLGDEFKKFSEQKILDINQAYENIKKAQG